jgi:hypothetical protein
MGRTLLCAASSFAFVGLALVAAPSAMQRADKPAVDSLAQPVTCFGNRRNYRNFNHCWQVNARAQSNFRYAANYCSQICATGSDK